MQDASAGLVQAMMVSFGKDNTGNEGLDSEMDHIGVRLDSTILCGVCRVAMESKDGKRYICPVCRAEFNQE